MGYSNGSGGGSGVSDHGALTGLEDDDHPQYATNTEFDDHSVRHEDGGADEISLAGLSGTPADLTTHAADTSTHGVAEVADAGALTTHEADTSTHGVATVADAQALADHLADTTDAHDHGSLGGLTDDDHTQYLKESDVDAVTFTIGILVDGRGSAVPTGIWPVWRAPYACTVTAVRAYADTGTTTVVNAGTGAASAEDFCSANITIDPADAWEAGTVNQNQAVAIGETVSLEIVTAGTATQVTIQVELTRDLSP